MESSATPHPDRLEAVRKRNERLTRIGPGTPMGKYMRCFWHPIATVAELKAVDLRVIPVKLLGEKLALFRSDDGNLGLVSERCPHRGAALSYGMVEEDGIRCPYHAWKFDRTGRCVDQPAEASTSKLKDHVRVDAYPVQEMAGLIWAYLGPAPSPLLPRWEWAVREDYKQDIGVSKLPCNWLQVAENNMDPHHVEYLHMRYVNHVRKRKGLSTVQQKHHVKIGFDVFEYGIIKRRLWEDEAEDSPEWTVGHPQIFPGTALITYQHGWVQFQIRTPLDDTHTTIYWLNCRPLAPGEPPQVEVPVWDNPWADENGRYMPEQLNAQDMMVMISQGEITDHTKENLSEGDKGVALYRRTLLEQIERVERGADPLGVIRDPAKNTPWIELPIEKELSFTFAGVQASAIYDYTGADLEKEPAE